VGMIELRVTVAGDGKISFERNIWDQWIIKVVIQSIRLLFVAPLYCTIP